MSESWTIKRLLEWTTEHLKKSGRSSPRLDAEILLSAALSCQRIELYTNFESEPTEEQKTVFRDYVKRRAAGEPVAYLVGFKEFYSLKFAVNRSTLIPRPETELLVVEALDWMKAENKPVAVCDVGTGSGAIAVVVAKHEPNCRITAVDISEDAIAVAKENAEKHAVSDRVEFRVSDLLQNIAGPLDLVLSNPPYVSDSEYEQLDPELKNYEPRTALVAGINGTEIVERLIPQAYEKLQPCGAIFIEISPMIADKVAALFSDDQWSDVKIIKDLAELKRIVCAQKRTRL